MGSTDKRNSANEQLTRENDELRRQLADLRADPGDLPVKGCGDTSCVVARPSGMATNGGCRCDARTVRQALQYWRRVARFREVTIREMRAQSSPVVEVLEKLTAGTFVLEVRCTFAARIISIMTKPPGSEGVYRVIDESFGEKRSVAVDTAREAADYFAAWLREAQSQEQKS